MKNADEAIEFDNLQISKPKLDFDAQKDVLKELNVILSVKSKIRFDMAGRVLMEELIVLLCLMSLIYKQNILSFIIYFVVIYYTFQRFRSRTAISLCKYTILFVFLI